MMRLLMIGLCLLGAIAPAYADERPNFVVVLCDDLGWGDLENYGHPHIKTPALMKMAEEGIQFSRFYSAAPVCSPSRVGLLTGRIPNRAGVYDWIPPSNPEKAKKQSRGLVEMRKEEFTLSKMLKHAGYATCMSGKWHCNAMFNTEHQAQPDDHGFDHWFATQNNASPSHANPKNFFRNGKPVGPLKGYACEIVADEAISWLKDHKQSAPDQPFFIYMAYHEPHEPVASPKKLVDKYEANGARNRDEAEYFANVENLDFATGKLLDALDELDYGENTLVIFTSDNGPETLMRYGSAKRSYGVSGPWRGMKLHTHEAGARVAGIMRWPAGIKAGQKSDHTVSAFDLMPTFAQLSGGLLQSGLQFDGANFLPALKGEAIPRKRPLLWAYYNSYDGKTHIPTVAMVDGDMKVRARLKGFKNTSQIDNTNAAQLKSAELIDFEIYDLSEDPSEASPLPSEGGPLVELLKKEYAALLEDSYIWPTAGSQ